MKIWQKQLIAHVAVLAVLGTIIAGCAHISYNNDPYDELQERWFITHSGTLVSGPYTSEQLCASAKFASGDWDDGRECTLSK